MAYSIGVDLGQSADYSTMSVIRGVGEGGLHVVHLERLPLGTSYVEVVERVEGMVGDPRLASSSGFPPILCVDQTGVGAAVADLLLDRGLAFCSVTITSGAKAHPYARTRGRTSWRVPKGELVAALERPFRLGKLKVAPTLRFGPALEKELRGFRRKITPKARTHYEHGKAHEHYDLVIATALACWSAQRNGE